MSRAIGFLRPYSKMTHHHRNEVEQQKPAALVDIVKPANADGDARQQERQGKHRGQLVTDDSGRRSDQHHEQEPPPVFGSGSTSGKVGVLREAGFDRFAESHLCLPLLLKRRTLPEPICLAYLR